MVFKKAPGGWSTWCKTRSVLRALQRNGLYETTERGGARHMVQYYIVLIALQLFTSCQDIAVHPKLPSQETIV